MAEHHHYLTAANVRPHNKRSVQACQRPRKTGTGRFVKNSESRPLPPGITLVPPSPGTKKRLATESAKASREKARLQQTSNDGTSYSISVGVHGVCRINTKLTEQTQSRNGTEPPEGAFADSALHGSLDSFPMDIGHDRSQSEPNHHTVYDFAGNEMDWPSVVEPDQVTGTGRQAASDSRRRYKAKLADQWAKLIDGSDKFIEAFLHAEADSFHGRSVPLGSATPECTCTTMVARKDKIISCVSLESELHFQTAS
jgi:hypothetical protein